MRFLGKNTSAEKDSWMGKMDGYKNKLSLKMEQIAKGSENIEGIVIPWLECCCEVKCLVIKKKRKTFYKE